MCWKKKGWHLALSLTADRFIIFRIQTSKYIETFALNCLIVIIVMLFYGLYCCNILIFYLGARIAQTLQDRQGTYNTTEKHLLAIKWLFCLQLLCDTFLILIRIEWQMFIGLHIKCWSFLWDLNMTWIFWTFLKSLQIPNMEIHPVGAALFHVERQTRQNKWLFFTLLWTCRIVTGLCAGWQESVGFPTGRGDFSFLQSVWTGCVVQTASCSMCALVQLLSLPPYPDKVKNAWSLTIGSTYALMRCTRTTFITTLVIHFV